MKDLIGDSLEVRCIICLYPGETVGDDCPDCGDENSMQIYDTKKGLEMDIKEKLELHKLWLESDGREGERACFDNHDLSDSDIILAELSYVEASNADFSRADLYCSNFTDSNLSNTNLSNANLHQVNFINCNLAFSDLSNANVYYADFTNANLYKANIEDIEINYSIGNGREIISYRADPYHICHTVDVLAIECKRYKIEEWKTFTDDEIAYMDKGALKWWRENKDMIFDRIDKQRMDLK